MDRVILHSDLNNFYASVECLYNPGLKDKPVAVCGSQSTRHGIVLAKNYLAKKYGVKTAETVREALDKCPGLVIVKPNYPLYLKFSAMARRIYERYTDMVESFGIDESWLDVTESVRLFGNGYKIAEEIRESIKSELGITVSVGVSYSKTFSKMASDMKKPDAVTVITRGNFRERLWELPVKELLYVGASTREKLNNAAIFTIGDLAAASPDFLARLLGVWGRKLWLFANGHDETPVMRTDRESVIKGIGNSITTPRDMVSDGDIRTLSYVLAESVAERLRRNSFKGRTVQIWVRDCKLDSMTRQAKLPRHTDVTAEIAEKAHEIFLKSWDWKNPVRAYGIRVTDLVAADGYMQMSMLPDDRHAKRELLDQSIDRIRARFGHYSVQRALLLKDCKLNANPIEENAIHPVPYFR